MDYAGALEYIASRSDYDRGFIQNPFAGDEFARLGLLRTKALLAELKDPQDDLTIVHVAGTKGKGSTSATIATIAHAAGRRVGLYATPHLHTFRERIQLNLEPIGSQAFSELVAEGQSAVERAEQAHRELGAITAFELVTALALRAFANAEVDLAIVEVGLGGRLDATNVVEPAVAAITSISFDHTAILGETLSEIASEKAGIIKPGRPVVVGPQPSEAMRTIELIAQERDSPLYKAGTDWIAACSWRAATFDGPWGVVGPARLALVGQHQVENTGVALAALWHADPTALSDSKVVSTALEAVRWPGRFEVIAERPTIIADGAHNVDAIERLVATTRDAYPDATVAVVLGTSKDKDARGMLGALIEITNKIYCVESSNPRARAASDLAEQGRAMGFDVMAFTSVSEALAQAGTDASAADVIVVTGSLYVVAEAREAVGLASVDPVEQRLYNA